MPTEIQVPPRALFTPLGKTIAVMVYRVDDPRVNGIALPENSKSSDELITPVGLVIAVGPKCEQTKVGDQILFYNDTVARRVRHRGEKYLMVHEDQIVGVLNEEGRIATGDGAKSKIALD